jgi:hypothetical protein
MGGDDESHAGIAIPSGLESRAPLFPFNDARAPGPALNRLFSGISGA